MPGPYELGTIQGVAGGTPLPVTGVAGAAPMPVGVQHDADVVFLASAARTTTQTQADQANATKQGIEVLINMSVVGTGSITVTIQGKDPISGNYFTVLASAAIVTNILTRLRVYPGLTAAANSRENDVLPSVWRILVTANNANSATYSVGYRLLG